jgi:hypothetical protein
MTLPILLGLFLVSFANKCGDFSGSYVHQGADNRVYVSIAQSLCSRMELVWESSARPTRLWVTHHLILDGVSRSDPDWFGGPIAASLNARPTTSKAWESSSELHRADAYERLCRLHALTEATGAVTVANDVVARSA